RCFGALVPQVPGRLRAAWVERLVEAAPDILGDDGDALFDLARGDVIEAGIAQEFFHGYERDPGLQYGRWIPGGPDQDRKGGVDQGACVQRPQVVDDHAVRRVLGGFRAV